MTTLRQPFPQSLTEAQPGAGPDFPGSSGDRERGRFRPSATRRLTQVAVTGDDGRPIAMTTESLLAELLILQKATLLALSLVSQQEAFTVNDVLSEVSGL